MSERSGNDDGRRGDRELIVRAVARLRAGILAVTFAAVGGCGLFVATAWLLVRGGANVGQHLSLVGIYFPGYRVTWPGAVVGFFWGAVAGAVLGGSLAWLYNRLAFRHERHREDRSSRGNHGSERGSA